MSTILNRITPLIKEDYIKRRSIPKAPPTFEEEMEEKILKSFLSTFGTGGAFWNISRLELTRWDRTIEEVRDYLISQGFEVDIVRKEGVMNKDKKIITEHLKIDSSELRNEMFKVIREVNSQK